MKYLVLLLLFLVPMTASAADAAADPLVSVLVGDDPAIVEPPSEAELLVPEALPATIMDCGCLPAPVVVCLPVCCPEPCCKPKRCKPKRKRCLIKAIIKCRCDR